MIIVIWGDFRPGPKTFPFNLNSAPVARGQTRGKMTNTLTKDDQITILCTPWTTPSVQLVRNSYARNRLRMLAASKSEAEIWNFSKLA